MSKDSDNWDDFTLSKEEPVPEEVHTGKEPPGLRQDGTGIRWSLIAGLILIAAITILAAQNTQNVRLNYLGWTGRAPLVAIILATVFVAVLIDEAVGFFWRRRHRRLVAEREELRRLRSERSSN
ncbi:MAG: lipopolysaccharide assembly protein LapA domain-containing protein [Acidimicrobiia bacterium]|nr:lipopolysaccharide assembly protein LapA domain-containing protein [Acidimicrobiia bacterium]